MDNQNNQGYQKSQGGTNIDSLIIPGTNKTSLSPNAARKPKQLDYGFMDGLRGLGAFAVYIHHFFHNFMHLQGEDERDQGYDVVQPPNVFRTTPLKIVYQGAIWVKIFFILSGFVLPLRFFKTGRDSCLTGGTFRRYFRLMIPVLLILSLYYLFMRMDCFGSDTYEKIKGLTYLDFVYAGLLGTWYGETKWFFPAWTLSVELYASYIVYRIADFAIDYRGRYFIYAAFSISIVMIEAGGFLEYSQFALFEDKYNFPFFIIGTAFADMETSKYKPFDRIRSLSLWWKIPLNTVLLALFLIYGSNTNKLETHCITSYDEQCPFYYYVTFNQFIEPVGCQYIGSISIMVLALTSEWTQWILSSPPCQFLGKVSYTLYLVHQLFVVWMMRDTYNYFLREGVSAELAILYIFLIYTPLLLLVSWGLEVTVDTPAKKFSNELDVQLRIKRPPAPTKFTDESDDQIDPEDYYSCKQFSYRIWPIFAMIGWLLFVLILTETYIRFHEAKPVEHPTHEYEERKP